MILKLENLTYRYGKRSPDILSGVSFEFDKGQLYAVMGESGSGKTTLISVIGLLDRPTGGRVYFDGVDITSLNSDDYRAKKVSIIFQSCNLLYNYTALDNIGMALHISGSSGDFDARANELLEEVGIPAEKRRYVVQNLSGGEQQRVAIARAIAADSEVILADEPTGNLDRSNTENILEIFGGIAHRRGKCVIIVTHSDEVAEKCDCVLRLENGRLVPSGQ